MFNQSVINQFELSSINLTNLTALITLLSSVNVEQFNLRSFYSLPSYANLPETVEELKHTCNTTACIAGWMWIMPEFKQAFPEESLTPPNAWNEQPEEMMSKFLGISEHLCEKIIYGFQSHNPGYYVYNHPITNEAVEFGTLDEDEEEIDANSLVKLSTVIEMFEYIRDNHA